MKHALIIGGDSAIGSAVAAKLTAQGVRVDVTSRRAAVRGAIALDLASSPEDWPSLPSVDVAFLCAAVTKLDACENDPDATARINVTHMQALASRLLAQGAYVVFLSSNQVFDGLIAYPDAMSPTCPVSAYGKQKAEFETWLLAQNRPASVLRLTKVITGTLPILRSWSDTLQQGKTIEAFTDLVFAPLPLACVLDALVHLASNRLTGVFHLSGISDVSYYEIACNLALRMGVDAEKVIPASAIAAGIKSQFLPRHGTLKPSPEFAAAHVPEPLDVVFSTLPPMSARAS